MHNKPLLWGVTNYTRGKAVLFQCFYLLKREGYKKQSNYNIEILINVYILDDANFHNYGKYQ